MRGFGEPLTGGCCDQVIQAHAAAAEQYCTSTDCAEQASNYSSDLRNYSNWSYDPVTARCTFTAPRTYPNSSQPGTGYNFFTYVDEPGSCPPGTVPAPGSTPTPTPTAGCAPTLFTDINCKTKTGNVIIAAAAVAGALWLVFR